MAKEQFIDIEIGPDGTVEIESVGYKGKSCETDVKALVKALGTATKETKKSEYYQQEEKVRVQGRVGH